MGRGKLRGGFLSHMMFYLSHRLVTVTTMGEQSIIYEHNLLYVKLWLGHCLRILPKAEPQTRIWVQMVYLQGDSREQKRWGQKRETGREKSPVGSWCSITMMLFCGPAQEWCSLLTQWRTGSARHLSTQPHFPLVEAVPGASPWLQSWVLSICLVLPATLS